MPPYLGVTSLVDQPWQGAPPRGVPRGRNAEERGRQTSRVPSCRFPANAATCCPCAWQAPRFPPISL